MDVSEVHTVSTFRDVVLSCGSVVFDGGGSIFLHLVVNNLPDDTTSQPTENVNSAIYFNASTHQSHITCARNPVIVLIQNTEKCNFQLCHRQELSDQNNMTVVRKHMPCKPSLPYRPFLVIVHIYNISRKFYQLGVLLGHSVMYPVHTTSRHCEPLPV